MNLDEIRAKLDRLNEQIVSRFKDRSRFLINEAVYRPGAIPIAGRPDISLMEWALEGMERYHATLGRYELPDQLPIRSEAVGTSPSPVRRMVEMPALPAITPPPRDELIRFHVSLLPEFCKPGDEPQNYGETAYADADILVRVNERIFLGGYVAQFKLKQEPDIVRFVPDSLVLRDKLRDARREEVVLDKARQAAWRYAVNPDVIETVFRWMIEQTLDLEVRFLQQVAQIRQTL